MGLGGLSRIAHLAMKTIGNRNQFVGAALPDAPAGNEIPTDDLFERAIAPRWHIL
jgi:hypothetical protein